MNNKDQIISLPLLGGLIGQKDHRHLKTLQSRLVKTDPSLLVEKRNCLWCKSPLEIKRNKDGKFEPMNQYLKRQSCGYEWDAQEKKYRRTECYKNLFLKESKNPHYKGKLPKCLDCNKKIAYTGFKLNWRPCQRCKNCFIKWAKKVDYFKNTKQIKELARNMRQTKGIYPENLKPFAFKKGMIAKNKKFDFCQTDRCHKKHLAKGMCSNHWQHWWRINNLEKARARDKKYRKRKSVDLKDNQAKP